MATTDPRAATTGGFGTAAHGADNKATNQAMSSGKEPAPAMQDPFAAHRTPDNNPFAQSPPEGQRAARRSSSLLDEDALSPISPAGSPSSPRSSWADRRMSKEWDASKVPPSRFQKREGSIYATGSSRDSHLHRKDRDASYHAKLKEKGWA